MQAKALATVAALAASILTAPAVADDRPPVVVLPDGRAIGVVDGDSITVDGVEWRLRGYDTAETDRALCEGERRLGLVAMRRLAALLAATPPARVELVDGGERDRYRRKLGDLLLDGANVRETLLQEGLARPYNGGRRKGWVPATAATISFLAFLRPGKRNANFCPLI